MHLGVAFALRVLGRGWRVDDRGVHHRAFAHEQASFRKVGADLGKQPRSEFVFLQQSAKVQDRTLIGDHVRIGAHARKLAHRDRVIQRVLRTRVGQVVPLLQTVDTKHPLQRQWRTTPAGAALRIMWFDQRVKPCPRQHLFHLGQKLLAPGLLALVEEPRHRKRYLFHPHPPLSLEQSTHRPSATMTKRVGNSEFR